MLGCICVEKHGVKFKQENLGKEMTDQFERIWFEDIVYWFLDSLIVIMKREREVVFTDYRLGSRRSKVAIYKHYLCDFS